MEKKKHGFRNFILFYIGIWLVITLTVSVKLWNVFADYQMNYEIAQERANPDLLMPELLSMYRPQQIVLTAGEEWSVGISEYETTEHIEEYLAEKVTGKQLTYSRSEGFTDRKPVYDILADNEAIGLVTLKQEITGDEYGFHMCTLNSAEVLFEMPQLRSVSVQLLPTDQLYLNGLEVRDAYQVQSAALSSLMAKEAAEETGVEFEIVTYEIPGFLQEPELKVTNELGEDLALAETDSGWSAVALADPAFVQEVEDRVLEAGAAYAQNMNQMLSFDRAAEYFEAGSKAYQVVSSAQSGIAWAGKPDLFEILTSELLEVAVYEEDLFTAKTYFKTHRVYRETDYEEEMVMEWIFVKKQGTWKIRNFALSSL